MEAMVVDRSQRTAWVAESPVLFDGDVPGRFSAHWEERRGPAEPERMLRHGAGPRGVSLQEALAWARNAAPRVILRIGNDQEFSAGETAKPRKFPQNCESISHLKRTM
jgi:hypothetical protein